MIGGPLVACVLIWLATRPDLKPDISYRLIGVAVIGMLFTLFMATRTALSIYFKLSGD